MFRLLFPEMLHQLNMLFTKLQHKCLKLLHRDYYMGQDIQEWTK